MLRLVRPVAVWLGVACWLLLSILVILPEAFARWFPSTPTPSFVALYSASLGDEWRLLYWVAIATGIAIGYLSSRAVGIGAVVGAWLALMCAAVGVWLVYWALFVLPDALTAWTRVTQTPQDLLALGQDLLVLFGVMVLAVMQGTVTGAAGGMLGFGIYSFSHRARRTQTPVGV
jgi:hypothetical protein